MKLHGGYTREIGRASATMVSQLGTSTSPRSDAPASSYAEKLWCQFRLPDFLHFARPTESPRAAVGRRRTMQVGTGFLETSFHPLISSSWLAITPRLWRSSQTPSDSRTRVPLIACGLDAH